MISSEVGIHCLTPPRAPLSQGSSLGWVEGRQSHLRRSNFQQRILLSLLSALKKIIQLKKLKTLKHTHTKFNCLFCIEKPDLKVLYLQIRKKFGFQINIMHILRLKMTPKEKRMIILYACAYPSLAYAGQRKPVISY